MKVNSLKLNDQDYPEILRQIYDPPAQLFWAGAAPAEFVNRPKVAIVGSRKASAYGKAITHKLASELARSGVVILSGLAFGIDSEAHRAALEASGLTIAVLASPVDKPYPASHLSLAHEIITSGGSLISEYGPNAPIYKDNFIARNRIVSGLADILLITEAAKNSGSLHTARFALEQGKTVMAVPGNITSLTSEGCNNLIKSGASPVTDVSDIFFALNLRPREIKSNKIFKGGKNEQLLLDLINQGVQEQEDLVSRSQLDGPAFSSALTTLEINGYIRAQSGRFSPS